MKKTVKEEPNELTAARIAVIYAAFSGAWILFSDRILFSLISDSQTLTRLQTFKGWAFVLISAFLIHSLCRREVRRVVMIRKRLQESEEKYRVMVESSPDLLYRTDLAGKIVFISPSVFQMSGYTVEEATGMDMAKEVYADPKDRAAFLERLAAQGYVKNFEARLRRKNGSLWWAATNSHFYRDDRGNVLGVEGVTRDITQKKEAEQALLESEQQLRAIFEANPDPMVLYDLKGYPKYLNPAFTKVFGWALQEVAGRRIPFVPETEKALTLEKIREIYNKGLPLSFETRRMAKDGKILDIILSAAVVKDQEGKACGLVSNMTDISRKKMLEAQYEQAQKMESLGTLAGGIAHDFNNFLTGIFGYIDIARKYAENEKAQRALGKALAASDRAKALTRQLLTFSKGGAPVKETAALGGLLRETADFALSGANVSCWFEIPEDLWSCEFDKNQICQVVDNIVINAQHAMPEGGTIRLRAENVGGGLPQSVNLPPGKYVKISVTDTGTGIPPKDLSRIFDPFFSTKQAGSGLGLATAYSIVKRHGGRIAVESEVGAGTRFDIYLPSTGTTGTEVATEDEPDYRGDGTVLIMDDEALIRDMLGNMLRDLGFDVIETGNGEEALARFSNPETLLAAVILDLTVPGGMGGKETVRRIRERDRAIPVFVASGYSEDDALASPEAFGFTASLEKPFLSANLKKVLMKHLG